MSTKIHNGYRLPMMNTMDLLIFCKEMRTKLTKAAHSEYVKFMARELTQLYDSATINEKVRDNMKYPTVLSCIRSEFRERRDEVQTKRYRDPEIDFSANALFIPYAYHNSILVLFYAENSLLTKIWKNDERVSDYHYQNSTDKPERISEEEWEERSKVWDAVLDGDGWGIPSQNGFAFEFTLLQQAFPQVGANCHKHIPSLKKRAHGLAVNAVIRDAINRMKTDLKDEDSSDQVFEALRFVRSKEALPEITAHITRIKKLLKAKLTVEDFSEPFPGKSVPLKL